MNDIERKLKVYSTERFTASKFQSEDVAALYFFWNPTEGPFIVVPCLEEEGKETKYTLTCNNYFKSVNALKFIVIIN